MKLFLREIKQAKSCFIVVVCFCVLGFLPTTIAVPFFPSLVCLDQFEKLAIKIWIITLGLMCNSSVNSVIFFWTKRISVEKGSCEDVKHHETMLKMMSTPFCASVLLITNGHPPDINIAQILHLSNFFELKRRVYIHLQAWQTRKVLDIQL
jgi:hypothetical protein